MTTGELGHIIATSASAVAAVCDIILMIMLWCWYGPNSKTIVAITLATAAILPIIVAIRELQKRMRSIRRWRMAIFQNLCVLVFQRPNCPEEPEAGFSFPQQSLPRLERTAIR